MSGSGGKSAMCGTALVPADAGGTAAPFKETGGLTKTSLGRAEVLRSFRHYLRGTKPPRTSHHRTPGGERGGVERDSAERSFLRGRRERVIVNQTNIGTVSKATFREIPERRGGGHMCFPERIDTILN